MTKHYSVFHFFFPNILENNNDRLFGPSRCLDGYRDIDCGDGGCWTPKTNQTGEWLQIDLGDTFYLKNLTLDFRGDQDPYSVIPDDAGGSDGNWNDIMARPSSLLSPDDRWGAFY